MQVTHLYLMLGLWVTAHLAVSKNVTQCYWSGAEMFNFTCPDGIIQINQVYTLNKLRTSDCTTKQYDPLRNITAVYQECCVYSDNDCRTVYNGPSRHTYLACMSLTRCENKPATHQDRQCRDDYLPDSNYMMIDYDCVARDDILPIASNQKKTNSSVTIGSPKFPNGSFPVQEGGKCSVRSTCRTSLILTALILQLAKDEHGVCQQYLEVKDAHTAIRFACSKNTNNTTFELYNKFSNFFILTLNNTLHEAKGRMWLEVTSSSTEAMLDVRCGTSALTSPPSVPDCSTNPSMASPFISPRPTYPNGSRSYTGSQFPSSPVATDSSGSDVSPGVSSGNRGSVVDNTGSGSGSTSGNTKGTGGTAKNISPGAAVSYLFPSSTVSNEGQGRSVKEKMTNSKGLDAGMIGGICAAAIAICLLPIICCIVWRHKKKVVTTINDDSQPVSNGLPMPQPSGPLPATTVPSSTQGPRFEPDHDPIEQDDPVVLRIPSPSQPPPNRLPPLVLHDPPRMPDVEA